MMLVAARIEDAEKIADLVNSAYRGDYSKQGWTTEAEILGGTRVDREKIVEMITEQDAHIELAFEKNKLIGCVYLKRVDADKLYFGILVIEPSLQGQGLGKKMLNHLETLAKIWGMDKICMEVIHTRKELIEYYERRGYRRTGKWQPFPENDPRFGIPKLEGLKLLEFEKKLSYSQTKSS